MITQVRPLIEVLGEVPDFRSEQGKRYSLSAVLALAVSAMLCGYRSYGAIAEWGRNYGTGLVRALGFSQARTPCAATFNTIFRHLEVEKLEAALGKWAETLLQSVPLTAEEEEAVGLDGKSLRGSRKQGALNGHLLSALGHRLGLTLFQQAVADRSNEIPQVTELLQGLVIEGRIFTMDALLTQTKIARQIITGGGHYVMIVKGNQPQLQMALAALFAQPSSTTQPRPRAQTLEVGHGRIEQRTLTTSETFAGYDYWPGLQQVFQLARQVTVKKTGQVRAEVVYGVTSLSQQRADPATLLRLVRGQWLIENQSHWVRDVTFDEDRSQVRVGHLPQVMATLRNTVIGLLRYTGETNIAAACRRLAAQPWAALALMGISQKTE